MPSTVSNRRPISTTATASRFTVGTITKATLELPSCLSGPSRFNWRHPSRGRDRWRSWHGEVMRVEVLIRDDAGKLVSEYYVENAQVKLPYYVTASLTEHGVGIVDTVVTDNESNTFVQSRPTFEGPRLLEEWE